MNPAESFCVRPVFDAEAVSLDGMKKFMGILLLLNRRSYRSRFRFELLKIGVNAKLTNHLVLWKLQD